jgi:DNA-directed RNA polymerase
LSNLGPQLTPLQREYMQLAVRLIIPEFELKKKIEIEPEQNVLTKNLKDKIDPNSYSQQPSFYEKNISKKDFMEKFKHQLEQEKNLIIKVPSIMNTAELSAHDQKIKAEILESFRVAIYKKFSATRLLLQDKTSKKDTFLLPFLNCLPLRIYVDIILKHVLKFSQLSQFYSPNFSYLSIVLGSTIEAKFQEYSKSKDKNYSRKLESMFNDYLDYRFSKLNDESIVTTKKMMHYSDKNDRELWQSLIEKYEIDDGQNFSWPSELRTQLGVYILDNVVFKACKIDKSLTDGRITQKDLLVNKISSGSAINRIKKTEIAFHKIYRLSGIYKDAQIKVHPLLSRLFQCSLMFESNQMPMLVPPMPWYSSTRGGYFVGKTNLLRLSTALKEQAIGISKNGNINPVYDSLNVLSSCPWQINKPILDLLINLFINNGNKELDVPEPAEKGPEVPKLPRETNISKEKLNKLYREIERTKKIRAEMHSLWCSELYRLSIANMYRDEIIWFPHSLDFRGRSYPIPPHFNHLG